jgi:hydrogenase maturation protein HypF
MNKRLRIALTGLLQGIGFRPFIYRLAMQYQQAGWVANDNKYVIVEIEGESQKQSLFLSALQQQVPGCGHIAEIVQHEIPLLNESSFQLKASLSLDEDKSAFVCPDIAVCKDCIAELFDPSNRRYLHPFISCCHCGPRYSLMYSVPYDRHTTSLRDFPLCPKCAEEYQNPADRRFHAQTIACHDCGPQLQFYDNQGQVLQYKQAALDAAVKALKQGKIVAVKSVGGFQLLVDATNQEAVLILRQRKHRKSKPFALMIGSIAEAETLAELNDLEKQILQSAAAPIVLVKAKQTNFTAEAVAPQQALLGLMLPYTPLHYLIMQGIARPIIATSANQHSEPICIGNNQAFEKLANLADFFLCHDRDILKPLDDSIVRVIAGKPTVLRRARGYVPTPITLKNNIAATLAVGGQLKNTVAIAQANQVILSQHLGDLEQLETAQQFQKTVKDLSEFYNFKPQQIVADIHSDYVSSQYAQSLQIPIKTVQHHYAHILSCMAEHGLESPVLGVAWDGTGLGTDNRLWGGEFLHVNQQSFQRIAHLRPFPLIGGFQAIKEPRRVALALLYGCFGEELFTEQSVHLLTQFSQSELKLLHSMLKKSVNCPQTTSIGRLFDGVASLLNLCQISEFEGHAAMAVERAAMSETCYESYSFNFINDEVLVIDWQPLLLEMLADLKILTTEKIAAKFHQTLAKIIFAVAENFESLPIVLSGGCFQNAYLVEAIENLNLKYDCPLFRHEKIPPNDGGLALGQIYSQLEFSV